MPRVTTVKKARKEQGTCGKCGIELKAGDAYRWWKFRYGGKRFRCTKPECTPRASDLTQSKMSTVYAAQETMADVLAVWDSYELDDVKGDAEMCVDEIRGVGEEYQEAADNQREHFPESETADENEERANELEQWVSDLEDAINELEEFDGETNDDGDPVDEDAADSWRDEARSALSDAFEDCPL